MKYQQNTLFCYERQSTFMDDELEKKSNRICFLSDLKDANFKKSIPTNSNLMFNKKSVPSANIDLCKLYEDLHDQIIEFMKEHDDHIQKSEQEVNQIIMDLNKMLHIIHPKMDVI